MLAFSDWELKTTVIDTLWDLMGKVKNVQEQMVSVSRDGNSKKNQKEILAIKNSNRNEECL